VGKEYGFKTFAAYGYMWLVRRASSGGYGTTVATPQYRQSLGLERDLIGEVVLGALGIVMLLRAALRKKSQQENRDAGI